MLHISVALVLALLATAAASPRSNSTAAHELSCAPGHMSFRPHFPAPPSPAPRLRPWHDQRPSCSKCRAIKAALLDRSVSFDHLTTKDEMHAAVSGCTCTAVFSAGLRDEVSPHATFLFLLSMILGALPPSRHPLPWQLLRTPPLSFIESVRTGIRLGFKKNETVGLNSMQRPFAALSDRQIVDFLDANEVPAQLSDLRLLRCTVPALRSCIKRQNFLLARSDNC
jgi:hypothetical protein